MSILPRFRICRVNGVPQWQPIDATTLLGDALFWSSWGILMALASVALVMIWPHR